MIVQEQHCAFFNDLVDGLNRRPRQIPPKYFYDDVGSALFEAITRLPEYGVTRSEEKLLLHRAQYLSSTLPRKIAVVELGSGSGRKTEIVLRALIHAGQLDSYTAIDVSQAALDDCRRRLNAALALDVKTVAAEYIPGLQQVARLQTAVPSVVMFLGSNIGNFGREDAAEFLCKARDTMRPSDSLLVGFDLPKPIETLLRAYDDPAGVTAAFNKNVLARANRELGCDFDLTAFRHEARWNQGESAVEMHLECLRPHIVRLGPSRSEVMFERGETIWTESSHKYSAEAMRELMARCNFVEHACEIEAEWGFAETVWRIR